MKRKISGSTDDETYSNASIHSGNYVQTPSSPAGIPSQHKLNIADYPSLSSPEKSFEFDFDEEANGKKASRACKGKRYLEFMARKTGPVAKKPKIRTSSFSSSNSSPGCAGDHVIPNGHFKFNDRSLKVEYENFDHLYANQVPHRIADRYGNATVTSATADIKFFDANDFDLEDKIKALPSRNLDKYLSRKRDTKKRKKIGTKLSNGGAIKAEPGSLYPIKLETAQEVKERMMMVGSQKRKARKESITRRDVNSVMTTVDSSVVKEESHSNVPMVTNVATSRCPNLNPNPASDLLILATIAEAAANINC